MTLEEAIVLLKIMFAFWANTHSRNVAGMEMALNMAVSALRPVSREQVERVWPGCNRCKDPDTAIAWERWGHQYCSQCGRPLSPEALEELRKKLEALNNDKK